MTSTEINAMGEDASQVQVWVEVTPTEGARDPMSGRGADDPSGALPQTGAEALMITVPALVILLVRYIVNTVRRRMVSWEAK